MFITDILEKTKNLQNVSVAICIYIDVFVTFKYMGRVMLFNATFRNISAILWWRKPKNPDKAIDLPHVTDKLYYIMKIYVVKNKYIKKS